MKTILNDATFIFVYLKGTVQMLRCIRNYSLLSVLATSFFSCETKKRNLFDNRVLLLEG